MDPVLHPLSANLFLGPEDVGEETCLTGVEELSWLGEDEMQMAGGISWLSVRSWLGNVRDAPSIEQRELESDSAITGG